MTIQPVVCNVPLAYCVPFIPEEPVVGVKIPELYHLLKIPDPSRLVDAISISALIEPFDFWGPLR